MFQGLQTGKKKLTEPKEHDKVTPDHGLSKNWSYRVGLCMVFLHWNELHGVSPDPRILVSGSHIARISFQSERLLLSNSDPDSVTRAGDTHGSVTTAVKGPVECSLV